MLEGKTLAVPLGFTDGEAISLDEGIILGYDLGKVLGSTLGSADGNEMK